MLNRILKIAAAALAALLLASCGAGERHGVSLALTDSPIDIASGVNISFSEVELNGPDMPVPTIVDVTPAVSIDLFQLQGGLSQLVASAIQAQPGHYTSLTLTIVADPNSGQSSIDLPDGVHILYIPPGVSPRVQIPVDFDYSKGEDVDLTADFDLRKSIVPDPNDPTKYLLIPSVRAVINQDSGSISGEVATSLVVCQDPAVYVYQGDVKPNDVDIADTSPDRVQPFSTALVGLNVTSGRYDFTVGFLPPGEYTVAFTCEAQLDVANQDNAIVFSAVTHASVTALGTAFVNLD
ncbi:MAG TPA: DUF4382 domain-containing protein [Gammaproteobacteria bacterium]|jgi:hypothetical protein